MVAKMHETTKTDRPAEEAQLDRAMTSMDPILQSSLKREQQQRLRKTLIYGGVAMATILSTLIACLFVFSNPSPVPDDRPNSDPAGGNAVAAAPAATPEELSKEGWALLQAGKAQAAEQKFQQAVTADPKDANLFNGLGWSQIHQQNYDAAIESFSKCVKLDRKQAGGLNGLGQAYMAKREYDLAEPWLRRASAKGASAARYGLARLYLLQGEYSKAKKTLKTVESNGLDPQLLKQMAEAANSKSVSKDLRAQLEPPLLAAEVDSTADTNADSDAGQQTASSYNAAGWRHFQSGENKAAVADFRSALKLDADGLGAKNGLGFSLLNLGHCEEALSIFEELVKANPNHPGFANGLARCYAADGDHKRAVEIWAKLEKGTGPPNALTWGMARSLTELKRHAEALPLLQRIKDAGGNNSSGVDEMLAACRAALSDK